MPGSGKTIFVTGGGGYVASHCIVVLLQEGFDVIACDNFNNCIKGETRHNWTKGVGAKKRGQGISRWGTISMRGAVFWPLYPTGDPR